MSDLEEDGVSIVDHESDMVSDRTGDRDGMESWKYLFSGRQSGRPPGDIPCFTGNEGGREESEVDQLPGMGVDPVDEGLCFLWEVSFAVNPDGSGPN